MDIEKEKHDNRLSDWPSGLKPKLVGRYGDVVALYPEETDDGGRHHARYLGVDSDIPLDELIDTVRMSKNVAKSVLVRHKEAGEEVMFFEVQHCPL